MIKRLPLGIQTFKEIIQDNYLYVDKTKHIHNLITTGKCYFISRPRRFGKSLLCSTLEQIFLGNKELFKGLWIYKSDYKWEKHPVVYIDMSRLKKSSSTVFEEDLEWTVEKIARENSIDLGGAPFLASKLTMLIEGLSKKHGKRVAIIIDEYDDPILEHVTDDETAEKIKNVLRDFYKTFKSLDAHIKFIFLTGITRFSKVSVFSGLNNLEDITMSLRFSDLLGYAQTELETNFRKYIEITAQKRNETVDEVLKQIREWYNGYRFTKKVLSVYSPYSVMSFLKAAAGDGDSDFQNYWFKSGTPSFLVKLIKKNGMKYAGTEPVLAVQEELEDFNIQTLPVKTILYQAGYLTISKYLKTDGDYELDFPNREVREALLRYLLISMTYIDFSVAKNISRKLQRALQEEDFAELKTALYDFYVNIPYTITIENEKYYQTIFFLVFRQLGFNIDVEVTTNIGRIDVTIELPNKIYIIEFKVNQSSGKALKQIEEKKYYEKFIGGSKKVILVGINFDMKKRNITELEAKSF